MDPLLQTPHCRKEALKLAKQEEWLSKSDWLILYSVLERDINAVDAYASIDCDDQEFCEMWVCDKVIMEKDRHSLQYILVFPFFDIALFYLQINSHSLPNINLHVFWCQVLVEHLWVILQDLLITCPHLHGNVIM